LKVRIGDAPYKFLDPPLKRQKDLTVYYTVENLYKPYNTTDMSSIN